MYDELIFTHESHAPHDAYVGGGAYLPSEISWPFSADGVSLTHLASFPGAWFSSSFVPKHYWISVFIPYLPGEVFHYRKLRAIDGDSGAMVLGYIRSEEERNEAANPIIDRGSIHISRGADSDDEENLASKLDGVDAWLQGPITSNIGRRRLSIYGGDLDAALPRYKGILSDGMGYLFLDERFWDKTANSCGRFFLQLG
ncbi:hypothetical protein R9X49_13070 [Pectobacterium carotovorum]|uniref:hypothetical protein n=1 Tax=Pectobacterium carotovorum TaxID=554 RepID=UPI0029D6650D|nr:hypothetical protein [Pectobacterium carotovorum]MDX6916039.1 hypothetical protein [Pectobacterium carotovorum]